MMWHMRNMRALQPFMNGRSPSFGISSLRNNHIRLQPLCCTMHTSSSPQDIDHPNPPIHSGFTKLGLSPKLVECTSLCGYTEPTPVQKAAIPRLLKHENLVLASSTGSGKTLAYLLPIIQLLKSAENTTNTAEVRSTSGIRQPMRPRAIILAPTRDLSRQILSVVKELSHHAKISSTAIFGGESTAAQKKRLSNVNDIIVASPGRLRLHKDNSNVFLSHVSFVVIDEVDTMLTQGFGEDLSAIIQGIFRNEDKRHSVQLLMATATLSKAVKQLLSSHFDASLSDAKHLKLVNPNKLPIGWQPPNGKADNRKIPLKILEVAGLHRSLPQVKHVMLDTKGADKIETLLELISNQKKEQALVFCNTVASTLAVEHALKEHGISSVIYHGDMNSKDRERNIDMFRDGSVEYLVCTDIASRGLDIPAVQHVIMFDFPKNPIDYLHRAGRTGRAGGQGRVTSILHKRDLVLAGAIEAAIQKGLPLDNLTSNKLDYTPKGKLSAVRKIGSMRGRSSTSNSRYTPMDTGRASRGIASKKTGDRQALSSMNKGSRLQRAVRSPPRQEKRQTHTRVQQQKSNPRPISSRSKPVSSKARPISSKVKRGRR